jgi:hypothetical protein
MNNQTADWPAFPPPNDTEIQDYEYLGLKKREWFAGQALAGLMANPNLLDMARAADMPVHDFVSEKSVNASYALIRALNDPL